MKNIELYDIITLDNNEEYTVIKELKENQKEYYLLAPVDEEEEPDLENVRIVEKTIKDDKITLKDIENKDRKRLSDLFIEELRKGI